MLDVSDFWEWIEVLLDIVGKRGLGVFYDFCFCLEKVVFYLLIMFSRIFVCFWGLFMFSIWCFLDVEIIFLVIRWGKILFVFKFWMREVLWWVRSFVIFCFFVILKVLIENLFLRFYLLNCYKMKIKNFVLLFYLNKVC